MPPQAVEVAPHYVQGYLCLADVAARRGDWEDVLMQSTRAIDFDPGTDAVAYVKVCVDIACTARAENGILFRVKAR